jgi:hypothetical protein
LIGIGTGWWQANGRNVFGVIDGRVNRQDGNVILLYSTEQKWNDSNAKKKKGLMKNYLKCLKVFDKHEFIKLQFRLLTSSQV